MEENLSHDMSMQYGNVKIHSLWELIKIDALQKKKMEESNKFQIHLKAQSGENSNKCNQCDFASSEAGHLRTHLKTHIIGENSNKCNQCDFASTQGGDLRRHLKTHSGEKSSKCNLLRKGPRLTWVVEPD